MIQRVNNLPDTRQSKSISNLDLQQLYIDLYKELRRYIWPINTVSAIADLEVATFKVCPTLDDIRLSLDTLKYLLREKAAEDDDLKAAFDAFQSSIQDIDTVYTILNKVEEVIPVENTEDEMSVEEGEWLDTEPENPEELSDIELEEPEE